MDDFGFGVICWEIVNKRVCEGDVFQYLLGKLMLGRKLGLVVLVIRRCLEE